PSRRLRHPPRRRLRLHRLRLLRLLRERPQRPRRLEPSLAPCPLLSPLRRRCPPRKLPPRRSPARPCLRREKKNFLPWTLEPGSGPAPDFRGPIRRSSTASRWTRRTWSFTPAARFTKTSASR